MVSVCFSHGRIGRQVFYSHPSLVQFGPRLNLDGSDAQLALAVFEARQERTEHTQTWHRRTSTNRSTLRTIMSLFRIKGWYHPLSFRRRGSNDAALFRQQRLRSCFSWQSWLPHQQLWSLLQVVGRHSSHHRHHSIHYCWGHR